MKKKWNLILSVASIVLTMAIFAFGVYAAVSPSFTISNSITFSPTTIAVDIEGSVVGYNALKTPVPPVYTHIVDKTQPLTDLEDWSSEDLLGLTFSNKETPIIFTFNITSRTSLKFAVYITNYTATSDKVLNTPSHTVEDKLIFETTDEDATKTLTFEVRVKESCNFNFENEPNNFNIVIEEIA